MRLLRRLADRLTEARHRRAGLSVQRERESRALAERGIGRGSVPDFARSPIHAEADRRPGQVNWLVARAVTLQYR
jgi:hypothetical protein